MFCYGTMELNERSFPKSLKTLEICRHEGQNPTLVFTGTLTNLTQLEELKLYLCQLEEIDASILPSSLRRLYLENRSDNLTIINLGALPHLETLEINGTVLTGANLQARLAIEGA